MSLNLQPSDIDIIEEGGLLDGQPVKLARSKGGFWLAIHNNKVLSGGSHPAIVKFTISKMFPNFQPVMCKSQEYGVDAIVEKHSHFLSNDLRKSGYDVYSIQTNENVEFQVTKNYMKIASINSLIKTESLCLSNIDFPAEFADAFSGATTEKALSCNLKRIEIYKK